MAETEGAGEGAPLTTLLSRAWIAFTIEADNALAGGLVPPPGCWRGEKPYLTQTRRVLAEPAAALPWHPMVLHRGGWPDGS